jgi:hypothetical protein
MSFQQKQLKQHTNQPCNSAFCCHCKDADAAAPSLLVAYHELQQAMLFLKYTEDHCSRCWGLCTNVTSMGTTLL